MAAVATNVATLNASVIDQLYYSINVGTQNIRCLPPSEPRSPPPPPHSDSSGGGGGAVGGGKSSDGGRGWGRGGGG